METLIEGFRFFAIQYGPRLIGAIVVLFVGLKLIALFTHWLSKRLKNMEASLQSFFKSSLSILFKVLLIISVMNMAGVAMTSFIAILGAVGLALGLALSGTLQNFAGGVIILLFKPFKVGDFITAQGYSGTVDEIQIFNTILKTPDHKTIVIPNGALSTNPLTNFSVRPTRRVDWTFGIAYGNNFGKAKEVLLELIAADQRIHNEPMPFIALSELGDSSVNIVVRAWVNAADYWGVFFDMNEKVYETFAEKGINIPFPQLDVHVHNGISGPDSEKMWIPGQKAV